MASAPPVKWPAEQLRLAVTAKGDSLHVLNSPDDAAEFSRRTVVAGFVPGWRLPGWRAPF